MQPVELAPLFDLPVFEAQRNHAAALRLTGPTLLTAFRSASADTRLTSVPSATRPFQRTVPSSSCRRRRIDGVNAGGIHVGLCANAHHVTTTDMPSVTHLTFVCPATFTRWTRTRTPIARMDETTARAFTP